MSTLYDMRSGTLVKSTLYTNGLLIKNALAFNPLSLFTGGKQGVWYDPSDKSTLFQDVAGTVPVTKDGDHVALMKDKSGNGNHAVQTVSASRPVYKTDGALHWLEFDGADDSMKITLSKALSLSGELTVATGIKSLATSISMIIEQGANYGTANAFYMADHGNSYEYLGRGNRAGTYEDVCLVNTGLRNTVIISEQAINSGVAASLSVNNLAPSLSRSTTFGGGGFGTHDIYIGSRQGSMFMYKGEIHGIVIVDSILSNDSKAGLKNYLATKSGVTL